MKKFFTLLALMICGSAMAATYPLQVNLPAPGYRKLDGTLLSFTEFKGTTVIYGTCDPVTQIGEEYGRVEVKSWQYNTGTIDAPAGKDLCFVAVVIGLDDAPMGRSNVAFFSTKGPIPSKPLSLTIK